MADGVMPTLVSELPSGPYAGPERVDCKSKVVITADEGVRGGKRTALKANVDVALTNPDTSSVQKIIGVVG